MERIKRGSIIPIVEAHIHDFIALIPELLANLAVAAVLFA
jgi:hypothetical protein